MDAPLLKTKLYLPALQPELIPRAHLFERLNEGLSRKLTLVAAPPGYGKTTLLSSWLSQGQQPAAWLSLEENDNAPARFLMYLMAAVQTIEPQFGQDILTALQSAQSVAITDWLPVLIDQLDAIATPFSLVLDDYHVITAPEIHQALAFLLDHLPPALHLIIATRKDPPLPLPRLRARGQLLELRQADLSFSTAEAAVFLRDRMGVTLAPSDVASLVDRTEGWIAGLQLTALSLRGKADVPQLIGAFSGSHAFIVDYFTAEVLAQQPESLRTFLLQTAILDRLCGPLCEAVTVQADGQHTLEQLHQANLFVIPQDNDRQWYRYHHLFRDLLRKQLHRDQPQRVSELHRRASQWYAANDMIEDAIEHALAARDEDQLSRLLDEHAEDFFLRGERATLLRWIAALPDSQRRLRPTLGALQSILLSAAGEYQAAAVLLGEVDQALMDLDESVPQNRPLLARAAAAHTVAASLRDDLRAILVHGRRALDLVPDQSGWRSGVLLTTSNAHFLMGQTAACIACLSEAIDIATAQNNPMLMLSTLPRLAQTYWAQGQLNRAAQICQTGLDYCDHKGLGRSPMSDSLFVSWGAILCERNELDRAAEFIGRGLAVNRSGEAVLNQHFAYRTMARVYLAQRNLAAAEDYVRQAEALTHGHSIPLHHSSALLGLKAQLLIQQGRLVGAQHGLETLGDQSVVEPPFLHNGRLYLAWVQLHIAQGNWPAADQALERLFKFTQASGQQRWSIPGHILRARLAFARQDLPQALVALAAGLDLAVPEGFLQDFLDEGEPLSQLLREAVRRKVRPELAGVVLGRVSPTRPVANPIDLVEPLSDREREVLQLIAEGLSNQEIAARLYLSLRTIKFHTSNILGKLGVKNRTEAVARARALGLLSA